MFTFHKTDEGCQVFTSADNRAVATVDCGRTTFSDEKGTLKVPKKIDDKWPAEKWVIHFAGFKFLPGLLEAFLKELAAQKF